jgi:serine protease AprX
MLAKLRPLRETLVISLAIAALLLAAPSVSAAPSAAAQGLRGSAQPDRLSPDVREQLESVGPRELIPVIVQLEAEPDADHFARLRAGGGSVKARFGVLHGYSARVPAGRIEALAAEPGVERISYDVPVSAHLNVAVDAVEGDLAFKNSGGLIGKGVGVAVIDTGVVAHPDLVRPSSMPQIVEVEIVGTEKGLADYFGHGTHVIGIINGSGYASSDSLSYRTFRGLSPGTRIISIRALYPDGTGYTSDIMMGIDWAIRNKGAYNIRVLNLSLGHPIYESFRTDPLCRMVRAAHDAGIVVVVAAGNDGDVGGGFGTITSPANEPSAITVGAMNDKGTASIGDDERAWFSAKGPTLIDFVAKPDLVAPGVGIVSARAPGSWLDTNFHGLVLKIGEYKNDTKYATKDGAYIRLSGTSMAAPLVSAAAAQMIQKDPTLNPATVKARLMKYAQKDGRLVFETGAGFLNVDRALQACERVSLAMSPFVLLAGDGGVYMQDTALLWGGDWKVDSVWGADKGLLSGIYLKDVPSDIVQTYGAIWGGGKTGRLSLVDNTVVTTTGAIWGGSRSNLTHTASVVDILGAIWGGGKRGGP